VITAVLGAPGSGKSTLASLLVPLLPAHVVLDWDSFMSPAAMLAGRDIRQHPATWPAYRQLVHTIVAAVAHLPVVLFTVCTPRELTGWPIDAWLLLDCADQERRQRLTPQADPEMAEDAIQDAHEYRELGLRTIDTTGWSPERAAQAIARLVQKDEQQHRPT
jgi:ABC-type cobalamin/Fe3+-siderophores transport system ATPase subunit